MLRWLLGGRHGRSFADLSEESVGLIDVLIDEQQRLKHSVRLSTNSIGSVRIVLPIWKHNCGSCQTG